MSAPSQPVDVEKAGGFKSGSNARNYQERGYTSEDERSHYEPDTHIGLDSAPLPPLKQSETVISSRSARAALRALDSFDTSPENPRNWSNGRKWSVALTVACTGFIATVGSSIAVPGIQPAMIEFGETNEKIGILVASCYVLGTGAGPFIFAPIAELYGRQLAYHISQVGFTLMCLGTAFAPSMTALILLRFFCGIFASVGPTLGTATCADMWTPQERGRPVSIYALGPMSGPVLGTMWGYWILYGGWRWLHGVLAILAGLNWVLLALLTHETYAPVIVRKLQYQIKHPMPEATGISRLSPIRFIHSLAWMKVMVTGSQAKEAFRLAFSRPPRLLFLNPVAFIFSTYYAYVYGILYLFVVSLNLMFGKAPYAKEGLFSYQWPQATLGLSYTGMAIGFWGAAATAATQQNRIYSYLSKRNGDEGRPEYRLVLTAIGMIIMPIGLFIFGWTAQAQVHWIAPQIGHVITCYGLMLAFATIQNFIVDTFFPYSAAAIAGATASRSVLACLLPIWTPQMFLTLGWGWGGTLTALVAVLAIPAPFIMFKYGKELRERYKFEG